MSNESMFPCACCGYLVFDELGSDDICPICWWQDDHSQLRFPEFGGGPNTPSLVEAQKNFQSFGASDKRGKDYVRQPLPTDRRDPFWRPIDPEQDDIERPEAGKDYGPRRILMI